MNVFHAIILGIVEGVTEFLPVSSTGHLVLASHLLRLPQTAFLGTFEIAVQLGAIAAVVAVYRPAAFFRPKVLTRLLAAFVPTAVVGASAYHFIKGTLLASEPTVVLALGIGGLVLIAFERVFRPAPGPMTVEAMSHRQAFAIGMAQAVAIIPGVSRSAASVIGGMLAGLDRRTAVEFSFLLAVPTILAATALDVLQSPIPSSGDLALLAVGAVAAFISALLAVRFFLKYVQTHSLSAFGAYRIILAALYAIYVL
jgi:undecaprenyl-diphosphatase